MTKTQLLNTLEKMQNYPYYKESKQFGLIEKLLKSTEENDLDLQAITPNILEQLIELLVDVYHEDDLLTFLQKNDYDVLKDFRFAEIYDYEELDEDAISEALFKDEDEKIAVLSW